MIILNISYHSAPESSHPFFTFDSFLPLWMWVYEVPLMHFEHEPHWDVTWSGIITPIPPWAQARRRCHSLRSFLWSPATQAPINHTQHFSLSKWPMGVPKYSYLIQAADPHSWPNLQSSETAFKITRLQRKHTLDWFKCTLQENHMLNKIRLCFLTTLNWQELNFSLSFVCLIPC